MSDIKTVIAAVLDELDKEQSEYQALYRKYRRSEDEAAKHIHRRLVELCKKILRETTT